MTISGATLSKAMGGILSQSRYNALADDVNTALRQANCTTVNRAAMFLAQIGHESLGLRYMEEIASGAAYEGRRDLGNTKLGDGKRFKGRGPIQITGRANYAALSKWAHKKGYVPTADYFVKNPGKLSSDKYGFLGAVWFWTVARNMNGYADRGDITGATRAINGGLNGQPDRVRRWNRCKGLGKAILPGTVLTKVKTLKVGDTARAKEKVWARKAPSGPYRMSGGKPLIRHKGFQFKVTKLARKKGSKVTYARTNKGTWYSVPKLNAYRKI